MDIISLIKEKPELGIDLSKKPWDFTVRKFNELFSPHGITIGRKENKSGYFMFYDDVHIKLPSVKKALNDVYNWSLEAKNINNEKYNQTKT